MLTRRVRRGPTPVRRVELFVRRTPTIPAEPPVLGRISSWIYLCLRRRRRMSHRVTPAKRRARRIDDMMMPANLVRSISWEKTSGGGTGSGVSVGVWEEVAEVDVTMVIMVFLVLVLVVVDWVTITELELLLEPVVDVESVAPVSVDAVDERVADTPDVVSRVGVGTPTVIVIVTVTPAKVVRASSVTTRVFRITGGVNTVVKTVVVVVDIASGASSLANSDNRGEGVTVTVTNVVLVGLMIVIVEVVVEKSMIPTRGEPLTTVTAEVSVTVVTIFGVSRAARVLRYVRTGTGC